MSGTYPTDAAWEFLATIAERNPELATKLFDEIHDGTFDQLDGVECRVVVPEWRPAAAPVRRQGVLL